MAENMVDGISEAPTCAVTPGSATDRRMLPTRKSKRSAASTKYENEIETLKIGGSSDKKFKKKKHRIKIQCKYCPFKIRKDSLKQHERTHTGERPFKCSRCPATFNQTTARNSHERLHIKGNRIRIKLEQCPKLQQIFPSPFSLQMHERKVHSMTRQGPLLKFLKTKTATAHKYQREESNPDSSDSASLPDSKNTEDAVPANSMDLSDTDQVVPEGPTDAVVTDVTVETEEPDLPVAQNVVDVRDLSISTGSTGVVDSDSGNSDVSKCYAASKNAESEEMKLAENFRVRDVTTVITEMEIPPKSDKNPCTSQVATRLQMMPKRRGRPRKCAGKSCESCLKHFRNVVENVVSESHNHKDSTTNKNDLFNCPICKESFTTRTNDWRWHMFSHQLESLDKCVFCRGKLYKKTDGVTDGRTDEHVLAHYAEQHKEAYEDFMWFHLKQRRFVCRKCTFTSGYRIRMNVHERKHHLPSINFSNLQTSSSFEETTKRKGRTAFKAFDMDAADTNRSSDSSDVVEPRKVWRDSSKTSVEADLKSEMELQVNLAQALARFFQRPCQEDEGYLYRLCGICKYFCDNDQILATHYSTVHCLPIVKVRKLVILIK